MKIAIITPSFNQAEFIERTIQSVIIQKYEPLEHHVIDGGSSDGTLEILERYNDRLNYISEPDQGQSHAINKGILRSESEIIGWLNSDDIYYPNTIKQICQFFNSHPEIDIVYGDAHFIDRNDNFLRRYPTEFWDFKRFKSVCYISQPATFFRRRVIEKYGLIDESLHFCMDYEYWLRLAGLGAKFAYLPSIFAGARIYPETKTASGCLKASIEAINMLQNKFDYIPSAWMINYASAMVKSQSNLHYPQLKFILAVWRNLWPATKLKYKGRARITAWLRAQFAMLARFVRKLCI